MKQINNHDLMDRFGCLRRQRLHEMCDFIEESINSSSDMPIQHFAAIVQMCSYVDEKLFKVVCEKLGFERNQISNWVICVGSCTPSGEPAVYIAQALLCQLRRQIGVRPTPSTVALKPQEEKVDEVEQVPILEEIPEGVTLSAEFPVDSLLDDMPDWTLGLQRRIRNGLKNKNRNRVIDVLKMTAKEILDINNVSTKSLEELVTWCYKHDLRGVFFDHPKAIAVVKRLEKSEENFKLSDGMA